jgi:hypothetical protein
VTINESFRRRKDMTDVSEQPLVLVSMVDFHEWVGDETCNCRHLNNLFDYDTIYSPFNLSNYLCFK